VTGSLKLLCFDLDDTLWPCAATISAAEDKLYQWMQQAVPEITAAHDIDSLREKRIAFWNAHPELGHDLSEMRLASMRALADEFGLPHDWVEPGFELYYQARQQVSLFADVAPALDELSEGYRLVAVTNGNADIHLTQVAHWFDFAISAAAVGKAKPHSDFFVAIQSRAGLNPAEIVVIGDDPERDIFGAYQHGMRTVWVNRKQEGWNHGKCEPDAVVTSFDQLADVLRQLEAIE
jgi:putative hydrolase of the HAD superfamily